MRKLLRKRLARPVQQKMGRHLRQKRSSERELKQNGLLATGKHKTNFTREGFGSPFFSTILAHISPNGI